MGSVRRGKLRSDPEPSIRGRFTPGVVISHSNSRRQGFTLVELLVAIGIVAALLGILLPVLDKVRERATEAKCMSNLPGIGQCLSIYVDEDQGNYPRTIAQVGAVPTAGTNPAAPNPFGAGGS